MNIKSLKCPDCGAPLNDNVSKGIIYCSHCGSKLIIEEQNDNIIKAKIKEKELYQELELNKLNNKKHFIYTGILLALFIILFLTLLLRSH